MSRAFCVIVGVFALLSACTQRLVCPAYQSSFIYDQEAIRKKFSYFQEDSTPKIFTASSKNKYLVAVPESYRKKYRRLQTVEMKPVYPVIPDSLKIDEGAEFLMAEVDVVDSAAVDNQKIEPGDSAYAITKTKERFNLDQDLYMWYFRELLVLPDVRAAMQKKDEEKSGGSANAGKKEKKGIKGFFQNLFKKKTPTDSTGAVIKSDSISVSSPEKPAKKGGLFKKKKKEEPVKPTDPKKKEEKEDGF